MSECDKAYAWSHAFRYASPHLTIEGAKAYADHYLAVLLASGAEDLSHANNHEPWFSDWRRRYDP